MPGPAASRRLSELASGGGSSPEGGVRAEPGILSGREGKPVELPVQESERNFICIGHFELPKSLAVNLGTLENLLHRRTKSQTVFLHQGTRVTPAKTERCGNADLSRARCSPWVESVCLMSVLRRSWRITGMEPPLPVRNPGQMFVLLTSSSPPSLSILCNPSSLAAAIN
ncbi:hypothetical protein JEQ12_007651 [Ovis aries]|uniref:Uncharacterized protein n=1 Tax=Ovis aries TaxID=9940 RepID=A0A835ZQF5_SHEEP|nr:hypothetical protein JEQ12_007651 [Ovis aries]